MHDANVRFERLLQGSKMIKPTALLTIALFFAVAPSPDAKTMSEITAGFLKHDQNLELTESGLKSATQGVYFQQQASAKSLKRSTTNLGS